MVLFYDIVTDVKCELMLSFSFLTQFFEFHWLLIPHAQTSALTPVVCLFRPLRISAPPLQVIQIARITVDSAVSIA
jgi:hypothetical protein